MRVSQNQFSGSFPGSFNGSSGWFSSPPKPSIDPKPEKLPIHEEYELMKVKIPSRDKTVLGVGGVLAAIASLFYAASPAPVPQNQSPVQTPQTVQTPHDGTTAPVQKQQTPLQGGQTQAEAETVAPQTK